MIIFYIEYLYIYLHITTCYISTIHWFIRKLHKKNSKYYSFSVFMPTERRLSEHNIFRLCIKYECPIVHVYKAFLTTCQLQIYLFENIFIFCLIFFSHLFLFFFNKSNSFDMFPAFRNLNIVSLAEYQITLDILNLHWSPNWSPNFSRQS